ncbi:PDZ domain-containing protein [Xylanibacillus composti]|uniref:PDZ domain-containing protein n=1 Tax=Xylanibacillus composti TaxID=1572762 RepID=A0A8J4M253_9BACL|nr:PDZ domain-containing protein [Xylanibacillus composti]MDT9726734.1 PDZ domain-containing protein [Xylanibacillus composti]GIQ69334.1 hypothetical protein XYCOK13_21580 [Xylanibacillus composti]
MHRTQAKAVMHIEASASEIWPYLATPAGMNAYLTDEVIVAGSTIQEGDQVRIIIGDMINDAVCLACEPPRRFCLRDRFRAMLADGSYLEYELTTTFLLEEEQWMTKVTAVAESYEEDNVWMQWLRECGELGWRQSLFNLKHVVELGLDLRYDIFGYPRLGVCNCTASMEQVAEQGYNPDTVGGNVLLEVFPDSPAARAGLCKGDLVLALSGEPVPTYHDFVKALAMSFRKHQAVPITYARDGRIYHTAVTLSSDPLLTGLVQPTEERIAAILNRKADHGQSDS